MTKRKRLGLIVPSSDTTVEADFMMAAPSNVSIHSHRAWLPSEGDGQKGMEDMNAELQTAARYLATAKVDVIACCGTTAGFYKGPGWDTDMLRPIEEEAGVPVAGTSHSSVEALRFFGAKKVSVATPYLEWNNQKLKVYLDALDFEVLNLESEEWAFKAPNRMIGDEDPEDILRFASRVFKPEADALFCSCSAWRSMEMVAELEKRTGKPVVTANQAVIWGAFRKLGITEPIHGFGRLLEGLAPVPI